MSLSVSVLQYDYEYNTDKYVPIGVLQVPIRDMLDPLALVFSQITLNKNNKNDGNLEASKIITKIQFYGSNYYRHQDLSVGDLLGDLPNEDVPLLSVWTVDKKLVDENKVEWRWRRRAIRVDMENDEEFAVQVKNLQGQTYNIMVNGGWRVCNLKSEVAIQSGIPTDQQRLIFSGAELDDDSALKEYLMTEGSTIHLVLKLRGGGSVFEFVDVSNQQSISVCSFSDHAPEFRRADCGINIEGYCQNFKCPAYKQCVIDPRGYGQVNITTQKFYCPICCNKIQPATCGLASFGLQGCEWSFVGKKAGYNQLLKGDFKEVKEHSYERFNEVGNMVDWVHLVLIARELRGQNICTICQCIVIGSNKKFGENCTFRCKFHENCIEVYKQFSSTCPNCNRRY